jgi:hypothetical protein
MALAEGWNETPCRSNCEFAWLLRPPHFVVAIDLALAAAAPGSVGMGGSRIHVPVWVD